MSKLKSNLSPMILFFIMLCTHITCTCMPQTMATLYINICMQYMSTVVSLAKIKKKANLHVHVGEKSCLIVDLGRQRTS